MLEPPVVVDNRRNYWGWISMSVIVLLLMFAAWANSAARKPNRLDGFEEEETLLKRAMSAKSLESSIPANAKQSMASTDQDLSKSLDDSVAGLVLETNKHPMAAMLYAEMRTYQKQSVPVEHLTLLGSSRFPVDKAFYEIYASPTLTLKRANELASMLPGDPFVYVAAKAQALEKAGDKDAVGRLISPFSVIGMGILLAIAFPFLGLSMAVWMIFLRKSKDGTLDPKGVPLAVITPLDADRLAIRAAQITVVFLSLGIVVSGVVHLLKLRVSADFEGAIGGLLTIASVFALQHVPVDGKLLRLRDLGVSLDNFGKNIGLGVIGFIAEFPVAMILADITTQLLKWLPQATHPASEALQKSHDLKTLIPILIGGSIVAPFWEELVFRGMLFPGMNRLLGSLVPAIVLSSLVFACVHPQGITIWVSLAFVGASSCYLSYQSRSLVPGMVMHCLHNTAIFVMILLM